MATTITIVLAVVALLTYTSSRADNRRQLARDVLVHEDRFDVDDHTLYAEVTNDGSSPIRHVGVALFAVGRRRWRWRVTSQGSWWTGTRHGGCLVPLISPRSSAKVEWTGQIDPSPLGFPPIILVFTDGNGRRWIRWPDGRLSREWRPFRQERTV